MAEIDIYNLSHWCQKVVNDPELLPDGKKTFCNIAVHRICRGMEYDKFDGMLANEIIDYCKKYWIIAHGNEADKIKTASNAAFIGDLVIAGLQKKPHGHIAMIWPKGPMIFSGKWNLYVPKAANVGKTNGIIGLNYAFAEIPEFFMVNRVIV